MIMGLLILQYLIILILTRQSPPPSVISTHRDQRTVVIDDRGNTNTTLAIDSNSTGEGFELLRNSINRTLEALHNKDLMAALQYLNEADSQLYL